MRGYCQFGLHRLVTVVSQWLADTIVEMNDWLILALYAIILSLFPLLRYYGNECFLFLPLQLHQWPGCPITLLSVISEGSRLSEICCKSSEVVKCIVKNNKALAHLSYVVAGAWEKCDNFKK